MGEMRIKEFYFSLITRGEVVFIYVFLLGC
jgi:hypothetical protein